MTNNLKHKTNKVKIAELKKELCKTDYKALKYAEGLITETDYQPIKQAREALREQIRALEK